MEIQNPQIPNVAGALWIIISFMVKLLLLPENGSEIVTKAF